jgi:hypothetical protein
VGKFDAVTEGSAGCENGIPQAHRANLHGQINSICARHIAKRISRSRVGTARNSVATIMPVEEMA